MRHRQIAALGLLVVLGAAVMVPAVALTDLAAQEESADNETERAGLGTQMSSFAQASAADAESGVDRGLWEVRANETTGDNESAELITDRAVELESRLAALQNRTERLEQNRENLTDAAYNARASALRSQIANVRSAIEQANQTAAERGVDTERLDQLRTNAANMTGPEVAEIARNITDAPRGPSEGPMGPGAENGPGAADTGNQQTPGDMGGADRGTESADNPADRTGQGNETAGESGPGTDTASNSDDGDSGGGSDNTDTSDPDTASDDRNSGETDADETEDSTGSDGGQPGGSGQ